MVNKCLVLGLGSMGSRHLANLRALRPQVRIIGADPVALFELADGDAMYASWLDAVAAHPDADAAIIASPTEAHAEQIWAMCNWGLVQIPFYIEKPIVSIEHCENDLRLLAHETAEDDTPCAVDYQYRFHPVYRAASQMIKRNGHVRFYARDDLLAHYGRDCLSAIAAHPIDTALWLLGPAESVDMQTDGFSVRGAIRHTGGGISEHDYRIDTAPRVSMVSTLRADGTCYDGWPLTATNDMYIDALAAWLQWTEGGERDPRTATLTDGVRALEIALRCEQVARHIRAQG